MLKTSSLCWIIILLSSSTMFAQEVTPPVTGYDSLVIANKTMEEQIQSQKQKEAEALKYPRNNFKMNLSSVLLNNYSFYYERMLTKKISVSGGYRFMPDTKLSNIKMINPLFKLIGEDANDPDTKEDLEKISLKNNAITLEARFYMGRKPGARGFYVSLMGRYTHFEMNFPYDYTSGSNKDYEVPLNGKFNGLAGGAGFGCQWLIGKRVVLDWYILGGLYGKIKGDMNGNANLSTMTPLEQQEMKADLEDFFTLNDKKLLDATVTNNGVQGKISGPFVGLRGMGISVGIAF